MLVVRTDSITKIVAAKLTEVVPTILQPYLTPHLLLSLLYQAKLAKLPSPSQLLSTSLPFQLQGLLAQLPTLRFWHWLHLFLR